MGLLYLGPSLLLYWCSIDLELEQWLEAVESLNQLLLLLIKVELQILDLLTGNWQFIGFALLELINHRLIVHDQLLDFDILFIVYVPLGHCQLLLDNRQPTWPCHFTAVFFVHRGCSNDAAALSIIKIFEGAWWVNWDVHTRPSFHFWVQHHLWQLFGVILVHSANVFFQLFDFLVLDFAVLLNMEKLSLKIVQVVEASLQFFL